MFSFVERKKMIKRVYIVLIAMLVFLQAPMLACACSKTSDKTNKNCCKKERSTGNKKDCCKKQDSPNKEKEDDCSGKCGHSSCHCATLSLGFLSSSSELKHQLLVVSQTQFFLYSNPCISSGFHSIWQPPKIS